jgi:hypothetical protein
MVVQRKAAHRPPKCPVGHSPAEEIRKAAGCLPGDVKEAVNRGEIKAIVVGGRVFIREPGGSAWARRKAAEILREYYDKHGV